VVVTAERWTYSGPMRVGRNGLLLIGFVMATALPVPILSCRGAERTAFELAKEGNRYVGEQSKDKVLQIHSEKSIGGVVPNVWHVLYFDPTATFKSVEVEFGGGKMTAVKRPLRLLDGVRNSKAPLELTKLKIDSDKAIKLAMSEPVLDKLSIRATSARLERGDGDLPIWRVRLWAAKLRNPNDLADIGEVTLSAEDGAVVKSDLHINRVD